MVCRDLLAQWRDGWEFVFRVAMLPTALIVVYGYVLPHIGTLPETFPTQMFAGMIGMSVLITGIHGTAIPLTMDFNNTLQIEDRLQAPVHVRLVALTKMLVGVVEAFVGGLLVLPISLIFMGTRVSLTFAPQTILLLVPVLLLMAFAFATRGLLVGAIVKPMQIAAMFCGFLMPVVFTGAIFFSWRSLAAVPPFQALVLVNPLTYASEALRCVLTPQIESIPLGISMLALVVYTLLMGCFGFRCFYRMVYGG